jgi:Amidohydrolase family
MMGLHDVGQINKGFQADIIIVNLNPLEDINVLSRPETEVTAVFRVGRLRRDDLNLFNGGLLDRYLGGISCIFVKRNLDAYVP